MEKKLYRNEHDKVIAGVASGVATYMQVDVTIIRLLFVLSTIFLGGAGMLVYIVLWAVSPINNDPTLRFKQFNDFYNQQEPSPFNTGDVFNNPYQDPAQTKWNTPNTASDFNPFPPKKIRGNETGRTIIGLVLLVLGVYFLLRQLNIVPVWFNIFHVYKLWPLAIVAFGISLIFKKQRKNEWDTFKRTTEEAQRNSVVTEEENASTAATSDDENIEVKP